MAMLTRARYFAGFDRGRTHAIKVDPGENLDWQSIGSRHVVIVNEQVFSRENPLLKGLKL
jgi:hypothetical protein